MDARLWTIDGFRLEPLKSNGLPAVARAIVGFYRHLCTAHAGEARNVTFVRFSAEGFEIVVRGDDWAKIVPYIQDGTLSPPAEVFTSWESVTMANIDSRDPQYYNTVLGVLERLFPVEYPTSLL